MQTIMAQPPFAKATVIEGRNGTTAQWRSLLMTKPTPGPSLEGGFLALFFPPAVFYWFPIVCH